MSFIPVSMYNSSLEVVAGNNRILLIILSRILFRFWGSLAVGSHISAPYVITGLVWFGLVVWCKRQFLPHRGVYRKCRSHTCSQGAAPSFDLVSIRLSSTTLSLPFLLLVDLLQLPQFRQFRRRVCTRRLTAFSLMPANRTYIHLIVMIRW